MIKARHSSRRTLQPGPVGLRPAARCSSPSCRHCRCCRGLWRDPPAELPAVLVVMLPLLLVSGCCCCYSYASYSAACLSCNAGWHSKSMTAAAAASAAGCASGASAHDAASPGPCARAGRPVQGRRTPCLVWHCPSLGPVPPPALQREMHSSNVSHCYRPLAAGDLGGLVPAGAFAVVAVTGWAQGTVMGTMACAGYTGGPMGSRMAVVLACAQSMVPE